MLEYKLGKLHPGCYRWPHPYHKHKGLNARRQVAIFTHIEIYMVPLKPTFLHDNFSPKFLSFIDDHRATPVQDTTQGDTGADVQQGPAPRILFRLRPCVNLFYCLLLIHIPRILSTIEKDASVLACGHDRIMHVPGHQGLLTKGTI